MSDLRVSWPTLRLNITRAHSTDKLLASWAYQIVVLEEVNQTVMPYRAIQSWISVLITFAPGLCAAVFYGFTSGSMSFLNKYVLTSFSYKYVDVLMLAQILMTSGILEILRVTKMCNIPRWSFERAKGFLVPSVCFAIHTTLALAALGNLSIPVYNVLRRMLPLANLLMAHFVLKKTPSFRICSAVVIVVIGCIITGLGDVEFRPWSYVMALSSVVAQSIYLTYVQKTGAESGFSALSVLHLNSINCIPFLFAFTALSGNLVRAIHFPSNKDPQFVAAFLIDVSLGCVLNYSLFLCATMNSALTTSLVGVVKSVLTTIIGFFTFGGVPATLLTILGVSLNTSGGALYSYAKYLEKKPQLDKIRNLMLPSTVQAPDDHMVSPQTDSKNDEIVVIGIDNRAKA